MNSVEAKPYPWILHPLLDLVLGCGGIVWLLFGIHLFLLPGNSADLAQLAAISATGVIIFAEAHTAATFAVVYRNEEVCSRYRFYTGWLAQICFALAVAGIILPSLTPILVKIYLLMVPHHFLAQAFGVAMLYCMKRGYKVGRWERTALLYFVRSVTVYATIRQLTYREWSGDSFLGVEIPFWKVIPDFVTTASEHFMFFSAIILCGLVVVRSFRTGEIMPFPAQLVLITCVSAFVMGPQATGIFWLYVSAFFHGAQYLMIVIAQRIKDAGMPEGMSTHHIARRLLSLAALRFVSLIALITFILYNAVPFALQHVGVASVGAAAAIFTTVNFFHIITDGALWKLRDPKLREQLVA